MYVRRCGVKEPRHSERNFRQKKVYLNTSTFPTIVGKGAPVIQKSISTKKRYTLIPLQCMSDDVGLRSPVIQKGIFAKKRYTLTPLHFRRLWVREPPSFRKAFQPKKGIPYYLDRLYRTTRPRLRQGCQLLGAYSAVARGPSRE